MSSVMITNRLLAHEHSLCKRRLMSIIQAQ